MIWMYHAHTQGLSTGMIPLMPLVPAPTRARTAKVPR